MRSPGMFVTMETTLALVNSSHTGVGSSDFSHALTRLTGPPSSMPSFSSVMYSSSSRLEFGSEIEPISDEELDIVLQV